MGLLGFMVRSVASAYKEANREQAVKDHQAILQNHWEEILDALGRGVPVDEIARAFKASHQVAETRTLLLLGYFLRQLAASEDADTREAAIRLSKLQIRDADLLDAAAFLQLLNENDTVFACTSCFGFPAKYQYEKTEGVLILSKAYLYFFEISGRDLARKNTSGIAELGGEITVDAIGNVLPLVDLLDAGWDIASNTEEGVRDFFDKDRIRILQKLYEKNKALAIPLCALHGLGPHTDKKNNTYFRIAFREGQNDAQFFLKPNDKDIAMRDWINTLTDLIANVAVNEGILFENAK